MATSSGLGRFIGSVGLIILFGIALSMFAIRLIGTENPTYLIGDLNSTLGKMNGSAEDLQVVGEDVKNILSADKVSPTYLYLLFKSAFDIPIRFLSFLVSGVGVILTILFTAFFGSEGAGDIVLGIISSVLVIGIVLMIIKAIRTGDTGT